MRRTLVGLVIALFGLALAVSFSSESIPMTIFGGALTASGIFYAVRPGNVSTGVAEIVWGSGFVLRTWIQNAEAPPDSDTLAPGFSVMTLFGIVLIFHGASLFLKQDGPSRPEASDGDGS